ncbi:MAG: TonB-dependent receptor [Gammaproteobacteria bacterium]|nr:TonB-dependent receptor [Gammaproteobacteria bacterium]
MRNACTKRSTSIGTAVFFALYGLPHPVLAEEADSLPGALEEVTVTANRREQNLQAVPYSLSVVSTEQLSQANVTDLASLATNVPGLSMYDFGARLAGAVAPIIRGINATAEPTRGFRSFEQAPVGTYIGNSPIDGYFQLDDLKQVEVLRGPQGTLYGAGALGGALRLIPNDPDVKGFAGLLEAAGDRLDHSSGTGYTLKGMVNVPIGDTLAFRASAKYAYEPGFIDAYGLLKRTNNGLSGIPVLANPNDITGSSGIYSSRKDWNFQKTFTGRTSLLWKPNDAFSAEVAFLHSNVNGDGGPVVNPDYPGGVSPLDPSVTLPAGGRHQEFTQIDQPFSRYTNLTSVDLGYNVGFATLSSTSSYYTTSGSVLQDNTYDLAGLYSGLYVPYYAGTPRNPRFIYDQQFTDRAHTFTQEVRLVSNTNPDDMFDYVLGVFYEKQSRTGAWTIAIPGSPERAAQLPCAPACDILVGPNDVNFQQIDTQDFQDKSVFGELTYHFVAHGQITFGARHFSQQFTDSQSYVDYTFPTNLPATPHSSPASKTVGKVNPSYEYAKDHFVYALWSQGFRRGGANSVPLSGPFQESPLLATYQPDKTNNYEAGIKGRFSNGLSYTFAVFDIKWDKPQISSSLPSGNLAVYNGSTAESKGFEIETSGPLPLQGLGYSLGFSFADAKLTSDFSLPANVAGVIKPGELKGTKGQQMPGSPKTSLNAALLYDTSITPGYDLALSLNGVYRSAVKMQLAPTLGSPTVQQSSSYGILNASAAVSHKPWRYTAYVTNLLNKQEILVPPSQISDGNNLGKLANDYVVNPPREIGLRIAYEF